MFECGTCYKVFPAGFQARENHCRSTGHRAPRWECDGCDRYFGSEESRNQHMDAKGHWDDQGDDDDETFECRACDYTFNEEDDRNEHEINDHHYCADCDRFFESLNNIKMHLNSRLHRGQDIACPFCKSAYTTATGMVHHLESGSCSVAYTMSRDEIYRVVRAKDPHGVIAKKLIGWSGDSDSFEVSSLAWNGSAWACYLCPRTFATVQALHAHVNSNAHRQALYHCPNRQCGKEFKALAAVINHLESETCGAMRFGTVQRRIGDFVSGDRLLKFN